jgi:hypothetical protein
MREGEALQQVNYQNKSDSFVGYKIILYVIQASKSVGKITIVTIVMKDKYGVGYMMTNLICKQPFPLF